MKRLRPAYTIKAEIQRMAKKLQNHKMLAICWRIKATAKGAKQDSLTNGNYQQRQCDAKGHVFDVCHFAELLQKFKIVDYRLKIVTYRIPPLQCRSYS